MVVNFMLATKANYLYFILAYTSSWSLHAFPASTFNQAMGLSDAAANALTTAKLPSGLIYQSRQLVNERIAVIRERYTKAQARIQTNPSTTLRIPKKIHQIWFGPKPFPAQLNFCTASCRRLHPDWEYQLWTETEVSALNLAPRLTRFLLDPSINPGRRSDVLRLILLQRFGGVYLDVDFYCCRALDELHYNFDLYCGTINQFCEIGNAVIGSIPQHPCLAQCLAAIDLCKKPYSSRMILAESGPYFFTQQLMRYLKTNPSDLNIVLPVNFFLPMPSEHRCEIWEKAEHTLSSIKAFATPESYTIHLWTASWQPESHLHPSQLAQSLLEQQLISELPTEKLDPTMFLLPAVKQGLITLVDQLGRHGADFTVRDAAGHDALYYAQQLPDHTQLTQLIRDYLNT